MKFSEKELQVIDIAEKLFADKGFEGTSVRDIAKEACGNVSMVSYYFGSKENLLLAVFERRTEDIKTHIYHLLDSDELTDLQKVNIFIDEFIQNVTSLRNLHKLLIREELFNRDSKIFSMLHDFKRNNLALIEKIVQHGKDAGVFKKDVNMVLMLATLVGTISQLYISRDFYEKIGGEMFLQNERCSKDMFKQVGDHLKTIFRLMLVE
jgi:AcrR family transcriptional regulator